MRIYHDFKEARSEIKRDLKEMGWSVRTASYQNREVDSSELATIELTEYTYQILEPETIVPKDYDWCQVELAERLSDYPENPGRAWLVRQEYWKKFLNEKSEFDYTYQSRYYLALPRVVSLLREDRYTRRAIINMWSPNEPLDCLSVRVPCSMYYHFLYRDNVLNVSYHQRSCDFSEHWSNDLYLTYRLTDYICSVTGLSLGRITHHVGSLHVYNKDVEGVF